MANNVQIKDLNLGGISDSIYQGQKNSVAAMFGFDLHSEPGVLKLRQKLTKESAGLIDDLIKAILPCSDGNTYLFGSTNGKVWQRTSAGVYSLLVTAAPAAGAVGIIDVAEYQGFIYYTMQSRLGRVAVGAPTDWTGRDDNWKTFANTDADFHPIKEVNQVLYIGDGKDLAQVDAGVYSASALDLASPYRIKALGQILTDILIGSFVNVYRVLTSIFRWNTWSTDSYQSEDPIPEVGINCFLKTDNFVLVNCGRKGNVYLYNGSSLEQFKKIPGNWLGANEALIHPNAACSMNGVPLFGLSNISGNPAKQGVYSIAGYDRNYPKVLNLDWLISSQVYNGVDIGAIEMVGTTLLVAWKQAATVTMTIAAPGVVTWTAHGLSDGSPIIFSTTGALPTGLTAGTVYFVRSINANTLHIYDTYAHAIDLSATTGRITTTGTQSGVHTAASYGVDYEDQTAKVASAEFETRVIAPKRDDQKTLTGYVAYRSLPANTSIEVWYKANHAAAYVQFPAAEFINDVDRKLYYLKSALPSANTTQVKVIARSSGNNAPEIEETNFYFE